MSTKTCASCRHWNRLPGNTGNGECRWRPPTVLIRTNGQPTFSWPGTLGTNWCGQWEIRPVDLPQPQQLPSA